MAAAGAAALTGARLRGCLREKVREKVRERLFGDVRRRPARGGLLVALWIASWSAPGSTTWAAPPSVTAPADARAPVAFSPEERARILSHGPWPPPAPRDASNRLQGRPEAVAWGRRLFADPRLSGDGRVSCASCHAPARAFQDGLPVAPGLHGRAAGLRNTPTLWDAAGQRWFGWGGEHDALWAASLAPLLAADEMGHTVPALAARVRAAPDLRAGWRRAHGLPPRAPLPADDEAVVVGVAKALAAFQATLVSPRTAFDDFRDALARGDAAAMARYPPAAQRGLKLFVGDGRCVVCHAGPAFRHGEFADIGVPFFVRGGVDAGRHAGLRALLGSRHNRLGPFNDAGADDPAAVTTRHLTLEPRHFGEFRVPGLRQLAHTAPFMHDGSLPTLQAVVRHYSALDEERLHAEGERILRPLRLTAGQEDDLVAFLLTLSR